MKTIDTLEDDINHVLKTGEGWTQEIADWYANDIKSAINRQMKAKGSEPRRTLRMSSLGKPDCQLWYEINSNMPREELQPSTYAKFMFGDMTESFLIALIMAAGHKVEGMQDQMDLCGIKGHRDLVVDGVTADVKSASSMSFKKFGNEGLRTEGADQFGYISQLSSYVKAAENDDRVIEKTKGAFIVFDKQHGHVSVALYDFSKELEGKIEEVEHKKAVVKLPSRPDRVANAEVPHNKSGNMKLGTRCSYCAFKKECWPDVRTFLYSSGPVFLTKVVKEPQGKVMEVK